MRIIRHDLKIVTYQRITLPADGEPLSVAVSRTEPTSKIDLWSLDYENGSPQDFSVYIVGTGHPIPDALARILAIPPDTMPTTPFVGTVVAPDGLVWHAFAIEAEGN